LTSLRDTLSRVAAVPTANGDRARPPDADWPVPAGDSAIALAFADTRAERAVLHAWLERAPAGNTHVEVLQAPDARLEQTLAETGTPGDPWLVPIRVAWLPRERNGVRAARLTDLLAMTNPRRPGPQLQAQILRHEPDRCHVVAAEPARLSELRARFTGNEQTEGFAAFVGRQAVLALERAERQLLGLQYKVPRLVVDEIEASAGFRERIAELAAKLGRPEDEVASEASGHLQEMVASHSRLAIDAWEQFGRWLSRAYTVQVDDAEVEQVRRLSERHPLAFLPSHRSYLDPLVLRSALHREGFAPNHVLGGLNVSFWPIGPVARRSGVVFIRRSIKDEPVYKMVLREYIAYLARKRFNLEWYIEGGRTRTGKLRPPRYGLLSYLVQGFYDGGIDDVMLIPTSIVYDQLYEVGAMAAEEHGGQKTPESLSWLVGYARAQGRAFGKVRINFGEPLSLRKALGDEQRELATERVAFEVCHRINRATPITESALVALALLGVEDRALTLEEVRITLAPLLDYVRDRRLPTTGDVDLGQQAGVRRALRSLCGHGVVSEYTGGAEPVWSIGSERHLEAAFYRNSVVHFMLGRAIAELVLVHSDEHPSLDPFAEGWAEALRVRDILKFEFFFARKREFERELREELALVDPNWEKIAAIQGGAWGALERQPFHFAPRVLPAFLEAYLVVAELLAARDPRRSVIEKDFLSECLGVAHQYRLQRRLHSTESISRELFATALKLAANRDLVDPGREELCRRRAAFAEEIGTLVERVGRIRALALGTPGEQAPTPPA
jgi:glycerol-3-phosphate O-acyltransferase